VVFEPERVRDDDVEPRAELRIDAGNRHVRYWVWRNAVTVMRALSL
jgi:hypothetical protein